MPYWWRNSTIGFVVLFILKQAMYVVYRSNTNNVAIVFEFHLFLKIKRFHIFRYLKSLCGRTEFILLTHFGGVVLRHMAQFFRHEMADGGNHASVGCTARHKCVSMAESCHPYGFGGGYGGYGAFFGLQRPPLTPCPQNPEAPKL